jgi:outer membrane protein assembly factor BamB
MMFERFWQPHFALFLLLLGSLLGPAVAGAQSAAVPTVQWQYLPFDGAVYGLALSDDGSVLVAVIGYGFDPGGTLVGFDPATGAERWRVDIPESPSAAPIVENGVVYAGIGTLVTGRSAVYALDADTGAQRWRTDVTNSDIPATPVDGVTLAGDTLFVSRADGVLLALDSATGSERWTKELRKPPRGVPFVVDETVYVSTGFDGARIFAFDAATGDERWSFEQPDNPVTGPVVVDGLLYLSFTNGDLVAFDAATGAELWRAAGGPVGSDDPTPPRPGLPLVADGVAYVSGNGFSGAATLAFDALTGAQIWSAATGNFSASAPALDGDVLLVGSDSGDLLGLDAATGAEFWRVAIPNKIDIDLNQASPPLFSDGMIFVTDDLGGVIGLTAAGS